MRFAFNRKRKSTLILESLATEIRPIERTARIMNARNSIYDDYLSTKPFQRVELFSDREREIVTHMCLRLADQLDNVEKVDFIRLRFYRFICMILEDLEKVHLELERITKSKYMDIGIRILASQYTGSLMICRSNLSVTNLSPVVLKYNFAEKIEKNKFEYEVPTAFLIVYGLARQIALPLNIAKYEVVMPELMQLMSEDS